MARVAAAVQACGKWWGTVAVGEEMCSEVQAMGARLICPGGDIKVMQFGLRELAKSFGKTPAPTGGGVY
jgi:2-keto-3-deoxy-L-rhamnonate aldolase RhmA